MPADDGVNADEEEREFWDTVFMHRFTQEGENERDAADAADSALRRRRRALGTSPANLPPPLPGDEWKDS